MSTDMIQATSSLSVLTVQKAHTSVQKPQVAEVAKTSTEQPEQPQDNPDLFSLLLKLNQQLKTTNNSIQIAYDETYGQPIVKVINTESKQVIRQFPAKEVLAMKRYLTEESGLLIDSMV